MYVWGSVLQALPEAEHRLDARHGTSATVGRHGWFDDPRPVSDESYDECPHVLGLRPSVLHAAGRPAQRTFWLFAFQFRNGPFGSGRKRSLPAEEVRGGVLADGKTVLDFLPHCLLFHPLYVF